jgi:hypothetical protein
VLGLGDEPLQKHASAGGQLRRHGRHAGLGLRWLAGAHVPPHKLLQGVKRQDRVRVNRFEDAVLNSERLAQHGLGLGVLPGFGQAR